METLEGMLVINVKMRSKIYFETAPKEFDMGRISGRLGFEIFDREISKSRLARDMGVSKDLISHYTDKNFSEESMQISILKSFAAYFGKDTYYFCNDYHKFMDTVDVVRLLKKLRHEKGMTQRNFAKELDVTLSMYKSYEKGGCRLPYLVYLRLQEIYGPYSLSANSI